MATMQLSTASATPSDYSFPVPNPEPALPAGFDTFAPPLLGSSDSDAPAVAESTKTAAPDDSLVLTGSGFSNGQTNFRLYGQTSDTDAVTVDQTPNLINPLAASVTLPKSLPAWSMYLAWPQTSGLYGEPVAVNRTEAWWAGSDQATATDKISVYGRNLAHANGTTNAWVYVKPVDSPTGSWATVKSVTTPIRSASPCRPIPSPGLTSSGCTTAMAVISAGAHR